MKASLSRLSSRTAQHENSQQRNEAPVQIAAEENYVQHKKLDATRKQIRVLNISLGT
jgi:hypothetical protein